MELLLKAKIDVTHLRDEQGNEYKLEAYTVTHNAQGNRFSETMVYLKAADGAWIKLEPRDAEKAKLRIAMLLSAGQASTKIDGYTIEPIGRELSAPNAHQEG